MSFRAIHRRRLSQVTQLRPCSLTTGKLLLSLSEPLSSHLSSGDNDRSHSQNWWKVECDVVVKHIDTWPPAATE